MDIVLKEIIEHNKKLLGGDVLLEVVAFDINHSKSLDFTDGIYILNNKDADTVYGSTDHATSFAIKSLGKYTYFTYDKIQQSNNFYNIPFTGNASLNSVGLDANGGSIHLEFIKLTPIVKKENE